MAFDLFVNGGLMRGLRGHANLDGAAFLEATRTAPRDRLYSIDDRHPGMFEVAEAGVSVAGELYRVPTDVWAGYSSPPVRRYLKGRRIGAVIPIKADEAPDPAFDRAAYRERNAVERLIRRLKQHRRVATRYEKRAATYRAMLTVAAILLWR